MLAVSETMVGAPVHLGHGRHRTRYNSAHRSKHLRAVGPPKDAPVARRFRVKRPPPRFRAATHPNTSCTPCSAHSIYLYIDFLYPCVGTAAFALLQNLSSIHHFSQQPYLRQPCGSSQWYSLGLCLGRCVGRRDSAAPGFLRGRGCRETDTSVVLAVDPPRQQ